MALKKRASKKGRTASSTEGRETIAPMAFAVLDVLGLRRLLESRPLEEIARQVMSPFIEVSDRADITVNWDAAELSAKALRGLGFRKAAGPWHAFISDAILVGGPLSPAGQAACDAILTLGWYVARLIARNSEQGLWLRGSISYGECLVSVDRKRLILLGLPIGEAYMWEKRQEWIGAMLAPSAVSALRECTADYPPDAPVAPWFVKYEVPLKADSDSVPKPLIAVDWTWHRGLLHGYTLPRHHHGATTAPDIVAKKRNTVRFCRTQDRARKKARKLGVQPGLRVSDLHP